MDNPAPCPACESDDMAVGFARNARGDPIHPWYCRTCGKVTTWYVSKRDVVAWSEKNGSLQFVKTATQAKIESGEINLSNLYHMQPCEVCGDQGTTEEHHWAPRHLFGDESYKWPTSLLCRACHQHWHRIVTPQMGKGAHK